MIDEYCNGCRYVDELMHAVPFCAYILYENHTRGCPTGKRCTKRKEIDTVWMAIKREKDLTEYICG
jgi:hypothetical protein